MTAANTPPITPAPAPLKVFISYAHEDDKHRIALGEQLAPLIRNGTFTVWHDRCLSGGQEWAGQIDQHLAESQIVLLLLSRHFLASDYCSDVEVKQALAMHHAGQARVVPVVLKHCTWQHSPLKILEALPLDGEPVVQSESERDAQDQRYLQVVEGLVRVARELHAPPNDSPVIPTTPPSISQPPGWTHKLRRYWPHAVAGMIMVLGLGMLAAEKTRWQEQTRADLRVDRADLALARWQARPSWQVGLHHLLGLDDAYSIAELHNTSRQANLDATWLKSQLTPLRDAAPNNADLRFIEARRLWLHGYDGQTVQNALHAVLRADGDYAAADTLLGLLADRHGELAVAERHYAAALRKAPDIPDYLSNHARSLLELGQPDKARAEYAKAPPNYVLALVESALAAWALGRPDWAQDEQQRALEWLGDDQVMKQHDNRHDWVFFYLSSTSPPEVVELYLAKPDKYCYVNIQHSISQRWSTGQAAPVISQTVPADCQQRPQWHVVQALVSADICRYILGSEASTAMAWREHAQALRQQLGHPLPCPRLVRLLSANPA
ncbi:hypothetical protein BXU06_09090 [Aquaspirillum sp. LM1]|nr:hypothetical protein BXU06_09090 [Aquaspirillum sp. LM1]